MISRRKVIGSAAAIAAAAALVISPVASTDAEACAFCGTYQVAGVESWDMLNVRSGPSASYKKVGALPHNGRNIKLAGQCNGKWCTIKFFGTKAWVNTDYLMPQ